MKKIIIPVMLGFGAAMALIIGQRMSTDAMAVVIGVAVGVASSVPTSILLMALLRRERAGASSWRQETPPPPQIQTPNFIVLNPSDLVNGRTPQMQVPMPPNYGTDGGLRRLRVVGDDDDWS